MKDKLSSLKNSLPLTQCRLEWSHKICKASEELCRRLEIAEMNQTFGLLRNSAIFLFLVCTPVFGESDTWGFAAGENSFLTIDRSQSGEVSGKLFVFESGKVMEYADVTGSNYNPLGIELFAKGDLSAQSGFFKRSNFDSNTVWVPQTISGLSNWQYGELKGITSMADPEASAFLSEWNGAQKYVFSSENLIETTAALDGVLGVSNQKVAMLIPRSAAPFWVAATSSLGLSDGTSIRTLGDSVYGDKAVILLDKDVVESASADPTTREIAGSISALGPNASVIDLWQINNTMKVPVVSIFDNYADQTAKLDILAFEFREVFDPLAPTNHCALIPKNSVTGIIVCQYHSTEYGWSDPFWLRTAIAFTIPNEQINSLRTVVWSVRSVFDNGPIDQIPNEDQWRDISKRDSSDYRDLEGEFVSRFQDIVLRKYSGTIIN